MALTRCQECNGKVSDKALMCPHCGFGIEQNVESLLLTRKVRSEHQEVFNESAVSQTMIEKRTHKRIDIKIMVKINREAAMLFNISKSGMKLATAFSPKEPNVDITLDNGENLFAMKGTIRWVSSKRSFSNLIDIGVEISAAPPEYYQFIDQLLTNK
jgi:hypothetical protein